MSTFYDITHKPTHIQNYTSVCVQCLVHRCLHGSLLTVNVFTAAGEAHWGDAGLSAVANSDGLWQWAPPPAGALAPCTPAPQEQADPHACHSVLECHLWERTSSHLPRGAQVSVPGSGGCLRFFQKRRSHRMLGGGKTCFYVTTSSTHTLIWFEWSDLKLNHYKRCFSTPGTLFRNTTQPYCSSLIVPEPFLVHVLNQELLR